MKNIVTKDFQETQVFAENFIQSVVENHSSAQKDSATIICLYGDLGYGKTTFVQGLAKGLGITKKILSPTFIIMRSYEVAFKKQNSKIKRVHNNIKNFYHVDLYRMTNEQEIIDLGLLDMMQDPKNIVAIEWSEKLGRLLPKKRININFSYIDEGKREISVEYT